MNDECPMCGAPYLVRIGGERKKLTREIHLKHVSRKLENSKRSAALEWHEKRLAVNWPCGATK